MREYIENILLKIDSEIDNFDFYNCDIIENSLAMITRLENILTELRERIADYTFVSKEEEILFFKTQKPEILGRLLFFDKVYQIKSKFPNGSDDVIIAYLNEKLDNLTYFSIAIWISTSITVLSPHYMMNTISSEDMRMFGYIRTVHGKTVIPISLLDLITK